MRSETGEFPKGLKRFINTDMSGMTVAEKLAFAMECASEEDDLDE